MHKILLAEDDQSLGMVMTDNLSRSNFDVDWATDGNQALEKFEASDYDICILDVMLPKKDGFDVARQIRENDSDVPILFLTAKSMEEDRLEGFRSGGDDYITKPFSMKELVFRIEVFLKRTAKNHEEDPKSYSIGKYTFDHNNLELSCSDQEFTLTQKEASVLKYLCEHQNEIVKRADILKAVWGTDDYFLGRSMDVFISKLRKYLSEDQQIKINNVHGVGFKLEVKS